MVVIFFAPAIPLAPALPPFPPFAAALATAVLIEAAEAFAAAAICEKRGTYTASRKPVRFAMVACVAALVGGLWSFPIASAFTAVEFAAAASCEKNGSIALSTSVTFGSIIVAVVAPLAVALVFVGFAPDFVAFANCEKNAIWISSTRVLTFSLRSLKCASEGVAFLSMLVPSAERVSTTEPFILAVVAFAAAASCEKKGM